MIVTDIGYKTLEVAEYYGELPEVLNELEDTDEIQVIWNTLDGFCIVIDEHNNLDATDIIGMLK